MNRVKMLKLLACVENSVNHRLRYDLFLVLLVFPCTKEQTLVVFPSVW